MAEIDPLSQQYSALWDMLESHAGFARLVKVGNRPKHLMRDRVPIKAEILTADLPEVRIQPGTFNPHIQRTSSSSSILCGWQVIIATGNLAVDAVLLPVEWEVFRAMANWSATLQALTWKGEQFVKIARSGAIEHGTVLSDLNRGIAGWSAIWTCETELFIKTSLLL